MAESERIAALLTVARAKLSAMDLRTDRYFVQEPIEEAYGLTFDGSLWAVGYFERGQLTVSSTDADLDRAVRFMRDLISADMDAEESRHDGA